MNELSLLQTFLAVYRTGSVTRAAERLAMTQPGASGHLKTLEARLGKALFEKKGRGLHPTAAAEDLARSVGPHLDALDASLLSAKIGLDTFAGTVYLGGPAEFLSTMMVPKLDTALAAGLRVRMRLGHAQELVKSLADGKLDLVVSTLRIRAPAVAYAPLYREHFVLIGSLALARELEALSSASVSVFLERIGREPVISYAGDLPILRRFWRDIFSSELTAEPTLIVPDLRAVVDAVMHGLGISVVPSYLCAEAVKRKAVAVLKGDEGRSYNDLLLGWNRYAICHPRVAFLRDQLMSGFSDQA